MEIMPYLAISLGFLFAGLSAGYMIGFHDGANSKHE